MSARKSGNWLMAYKEYTSESESPEAYHLFCGLSAVASTVRRNVWIDQGIYLLYPNLYAVLVGPPGRCGKSTAMRLARTLLYAVPGVKLAPDSVTKEELIRRLAKSYTEGQSALTVYSTELSSLIEPSGIKMVSFLTDIYDCDYKNPEGWQHGTKGSGTDEIKNPYVNLLAATTPRYIADGLPEVSVEHGFTSRVVFVFEEKERFLNPFPNEPEHKLVMALTEDLVRISQLKGQFRYGAGAREIYEAYYRALYVKQPEDYRLHGFHWRKRIHILKLAMLVSLAEKDDLILEERDIQTAIQILELIEPNMAKTFTAVGKFDFTAEFERIRDLVLRSGPDGVDEEAILRANYHVADVKQLESLLVGLQRMGYAKRITRDGRAFYVPNRTK